MTGNPALVFCGLTTVDLFQFTMDIPVVGEKATAEASLVDVGGPAANAAMTAALLGSNAVLHTVIGAGPMSNFARDVLEGHGVALVDHSQDTELPLASVWVDSSGERTVLSADNKRSQVRARSDLVELGNVAAVLLDGHYPALQLAMGRAAAEVGVPVVLDCGRWRSVYSELLPLASAVIMTSTFRPPEMAELTVAETIRVIRDKWRSGLCAASRGSDPILVADESGLTEIEVPEVDVVDTTGAGDVLHGAFLHYCYGEGMDGRSALRRAALDASFSCQFRGVRGVASPG